MTCKNSINWQGADIQGVIRVFDMGATAQSGAILSKWLAWWIGHARRCLAHQAAGSEPKRIEWYDSNHGLPDQAFQDIVDWLETQIGIDASKFIY